MSAYCQILLNLILHAIVIVIWVALHFGVKPYERGFYCDDKTILKPFKVRRQKKLRK